MKIENVKVAVLKKLDQSDLQESFLVGIKYTLNGKNWGNRGFSKKGDIEEAIEKMIVDMFENPPK